MRSALSCSDLRPANTILVFPPMAHTPSLIIHISPLHKSQRGRGFGGGDSLQKGIFSPPSESYLFGRVLTLCTIFFFKSFSSVSRFDLLAFFSRDPERNWSYRGDACSERNKQNGEKNIIEGRKGEEKNIGGKKGFPITPIFHFWCGALGGWLLWFTFHFIFFLFTFFAERFYPISSL